MVQALWEQAQAAEAGLQQPPSADAPGSSRVADIKSSCSQPAQQHLAPEVPVLQADGLRGSAAGAVESHAPDQPASAAGSIAISKQYSTAEVPPYQPAKHEGQCSAGATGPRGILARLFSMTGGHRLVLLTACWCVCQH